MLLICLQAMTSSITLMMLILLMCDRVKRVQLKVAAATAESKNLKIAISMHFSNDLEFITSRSFLMKNNLFFIFG